MKKQPIFSERKSTSYLASGLLLIVFSLPIVIAIWLYNKPTIWAGKSNNHGILLSPPLQTQQFFNDTPQKWTLILFYPKACQQDCQKNLYLLRQIQRASGKNQNRIARMLLTYQDPSIINVQFPHLLTKTITQSRFKRGLSGKTELDFMKNKGGIFISDPHGNMMLAYPLGGDDMDIFKDLRHLLRISQIG